MPRVSQPVIVAFLSAAAGVVTTLLLATLFINEDPQLVAAEQRFSELPPATARQIKNRFSSLQKSPDKHRKIMEIHEAVTADSDLNARLEQLHGWWLTRNDAQRAELRETSADLWLTEIQKQISEPSTADSVVLSLRGMPGPSGRGRLPELRVSTDQIDEFLKAAIPEELSKEESQLIESADPQDRSLACGIVILKRVSRSRPDSRGLNSTDIDQIFDAAKSHLLSERFRISVPAKGDRTRFVTFSILRSVMDHLSAEFFDRQTISKHQVEEKFAALETSQRLAHMMSDPAEATRSLQTQLKSAEKDTPSGRLASELDRLKTRFQERFRQEFRRQMSGRSPGNERPKRGRRRERGPDDKRRR